MALSGENKWVKKSQSKKLGNFKLNQFKETTSFTKTVVIDDRVESIIGDENTN